MSTPILQFGTSRFLLAHVALFVSEALARGDAIGAIGIVQTTANPASRARIAALAGIGRYPVHIQGREDGRVVDRRIECTAVRHAWTADTDWAAIRRVAIEEARVIVSNTGDAGYALDEHDSAELLADETRVPRSYPAKLLVLLHARWRERPGHGVSLYPCELIERNGDTLRDIVLGLARRWTLPESFLRYLETHCVWVNSLVDRIVSAPLEPVGAVAEPYALWAIERRAGMTLPCIHEQIVLTDELSRHARLKLFSSTSAIPGWPGSGSASVVPRMKPCSTQCARPACARRWRACGTTRSCRCSARWPCRVMRKPISTRYASDS